jgi:hypothetical protein
MIHVRPARALLINKDQDEALPVFLVLDVGREARGVKCRQFISVL